MLLVTVRSVKTKPIALWPRRNSWARTDIAHSDAQMTASLRRAVRQRHCQCIPRPGGCGRRTESRLLGKSQRLIGDNWSEVARLRLPVRSYSPDIHSGQQAVGQPDRALVTCSWCARRGGRGNFGRSPSAHERQIV